MKDPNCSFLVDLIWLKKIEFSVAPSAMLLSTLSIYPSVLCAVLVTVLVTIFTAQRIARRPLPGIPYNASSLKSFLGDITQLKNRPRASETSVRPWFLEQAARHKSAVVQIFLGPFARPTVLLSDYREVLDILTHRDADFKRGKKVDVFKGLLSHAFPAMESYDPRFKDSRNLMRDLMGPEFLKRVIDLLNPSDTKIYMY